MIEAENVSSHDVCSRNGDYRSHDGAVCSSADRSRCAGGAAGGALIGGLAGGGRGAAIGALVGAGTGALIASHGRRLHGRYHGHCYYHGRSGRWYRVSHHYCR
jgi:hypothetical protein